jgi:hypothetical protein
VFPRKLCLNCPGKLARNTPPSNYKAIRKAPILNPIWSRF